MTVLFFLLLSFGLLCQGQSTSYPCLSISGVGCVCGQGYINDNGVCKQLLPALACADGFQWNGTACSNQKTILCPAGQTSNGATCLPSSLVIASNSNASPCKQNQLYINGRCIAPSGDGSCPANTIWNGTQCIADPNSRNNLIPAGSSSFLPAAQQQVVCQTGYYYNCLTCAPYVGNPTCGGNCAWDGQACVTQQVGNRSQQSALYNRFYDGAEGFSNDDNNEPSPQNNFGYTSQSRKGSLRSYNNQNQNSKSNVQVIYQNGQNNLQNTLQQILGNTNNKQIYSGSIGNQNQFQSQIPNNIVQSLGLSNVGAPSGITLGSASIPSQQCPQGFYWSGAKCVSS